MSLGALVHCSTIYYQPNGVFVPISLGVPANTQPPQQQLPPLIQAQGPRPLQEPPAYSWSLRNLFGLGSWFGGKTSSSSVAPATPDPAVATLTQLLTPMRSVVAKFLARLQTQLETADPKVLANALRAPLDELRNYLIKNWPKSEIKPSVPPVISSRQPVPAIRGSIAAEMAQAVQSQ
ncbi:hypothetical protein IW152_004694 [Coemansia sp. BCRC 34962]|nr:hypothetical protein IW152_004694 [Coemansia sp. BCRC 34962]